MNFGFISRVHKEFENSTSLDFLYFSQNRLFAVEYNNEMKPQLFCLLLKRHASFTFFSLRTRY